MDEMLKQTKAAYEAVMKQHGVRPEVIEEILRLCDELGSELCGQMIHVVAMTIAGTMREEGETSPSIPAIRAEIQKAYHS